MIQEIHIKDFKSYQSARLKLSPLTMLIGANASGKSNALEAIRFLNWLAQGQKLSALQYKVNENDQVVRGKNRPCEAALLSDGTLRILAFGAILLSAREGSTVIVEEVDNGVHPSRAHILLATMHQIAKERQLTLLLSSHNPALLDALPDDAVPKVVFCYRNPETGYSELVAMEDIPYYPELIAQGSLGELLTRGLVDRFVKQQESGSERIKKSMDWLESIAM